MLRRVKVIRVGRTGIPAVAWQLPLGTWV